MIIPQLKSKVKVVFPNGPIKLGAGFSWWNVDLQKYIKLALSGAEGIQSIANDIPDDFLSSSEQIQTLIKDISLLYNVPLNKILVGGFSQGAMLSIDVGLKLDVAGVISWSAGMVNAQEWHRLAPNKTIKVLQSHGTEDPVVPFMIGTKLKHEIFDANKYDVQFVQFKGQHSIPKEVLVKTLSFIKSILNES